MFVANCIYLSGATCIKPSILNQHLSQRLVGYLLVHLGIVLRPEKPQPRPQHHHLSTPGSLEAGYAPSLRDPRRVVSPHSPLELAAKAAGRGLKANAEWIRVLFGVDLKQQDF